MRILLIGIWLISLAMIQLSSVASAEMTTQEEALTVAKNWVALIIQKKGDWGGSKAAEVEGIKEFKRGNQILGYFCRVKPKGFIVVSQHKMLPPVKAYSTISELNPDSDKGLSDLIKGGMERVLGRIEKTVGPIREARAADLESILEINYRQAWEELGNGQILTEGMETPLFLMNYQEGQVLTSSYWRQGQPYNDQCPFMSCTRNPNGRALAGCVAIDGAQVMHYWNWPPSYNNVPYDWPNMPDVLTDSSPQAQINAVAKLVSDVAVAVDSDYGCEATGAYTYCWWAGCTDLMHALRDHFGYSSAIDKWNRHDFSAVDWFNNIIKAELNQNRPLPYRIPNHSVVADGWQEVGSLPIREYHINYGWGFDNECNGPCTAWYTLDAIYGGNTDDELVLVNVYPAQALGMWLSGTYSLQPFPYRYFDRDASGDSAIFESGHLLQFLPNISVKGASTTGGSIRFYGSSSNHTRLFTRGDMSKGVRIDNGCIKLNYDGSIKLF